MSNVKQYRKKPVVVEAILFDGTDVCAAEISKWSNGAATPSKSWKENYGFMNISTLEGKMIVRTGDYIIKGVASEFCPCKPDIFEATYESVESN